MYSPEEKQAIRDRAALELLQMKATARIRANKTCCLYEEELQEILYIAGLSLVPNKEVEVM